MTLLHTSSAFIINDLLGWVFGWMFHMDWGYAIA